MAPTDDTTAAPVPAETQPAATDAGTLPTFPVGTSASGPQVDPQPLPPAEPIGFVTKDGFVPGTPPELTPAGELKQAPVTASPAEDLTPPQAMPTPDEFPPTREAMAAGALLEVGHGLVELRLCVLPGGSVVAEARSAKGAQARDVFSGALTPDEFLTQLAGFRRACEDLKEAP